MKSVLLSVKPQWVAKILNKEKTIEIRKKFPKDYVGWVYIYVTKALPHLSQTYVGDYEIYDDTQWDKEWLDLNGKVVARFWCDKVEEIPPLYKWKNNYEQELESKGCITQKELFTYLKMHDVKKCGYAIHITKLEIFDKPKEISEFKSYKKNIVNTKINGMVFETELDNSLIKAPQSWQFIEV